MMSLTDKLKKLYEPFLTLACPVTHYKRISKFPYLVWAEDGEDNSFHGDNSKQEQQITGTVNYFTRVDFDSTVDQIQEILNGEPVGWMLESVQYEDETNLIHYSWRWWVV